ncbi:MAG: preprotein translocase subunit SecE [Christensenellales bacterium]|jgi:preprotein translocase SecE subunit
MAKKRSKYVAKIRESKKPVPVEDPKSAKLKELAQQEEVPAQAESEAEVAKPQPAPVKKAAAKKPAQKPARQRQKIDIAKKFREVISELKKVDWPPFKKTAHNNGVYQNTSTVLFMVLLFAIIVVAFDSGLLALLRLLTQSS